MKSLEAWLEEYGESHQNKTNKAIHWVCVPVIYLTVMGLLWSVPVPEFMQAYPGVNWASLMMIPVLVFYFRLSPLIGLGMSLFSLGCWWSLAWYESLAHWDVWVMSLLVFAVMWVGQFIGHAIEGKKPSFFKDLQFLLIGPAWVMAYFLNKLSAKP